MSAAFSGLGTFFLSVASLGAGETLVLAGGRFTDEEAETGMSGLMSSVIVTAAEAAPGFVAVAVL